jgi:hypothetical protein
MYGAFDSQMGYMRMRCAVRVVGRRCKGRWLVWRGNWMGSGWEVACTEGVGGCEFRSPEDG